MRGKRRSREGEAGGSRGTRSGREAASARSGSTGELLQDAAASSGDKKEAAAIWVAGNANRAATASSGGVPKVHPGKGAAGRVSSGLSEEQPAKEADTVKDIHESDSDEIAQVDEEDAEVKEAELLIKELNELCIGEPISDEEFLGYFDSLAPQPPSIDLRVHLTKEELAKQNDRHALCRLRYYQYKLKQASKEALCDDKWKGILDISEDDCNREFLREENFFRHFEQDETFDWFFYRGYVNCSFLDDYQRLVLKNYGYSEWSEYHAYLHSYETEQEYVRYCKELSKQLKWMEPYVDIDQSSVKWGKISSRGALQAIKIAATSFPKITSCLAFTGYYECKESMSYDTMWFKEFDGLYFEIWRRVTQGMSFEKALGEVYSLNMFPLRQRMMKAALEYNETMQMMAEEYLTCTEAIKTEVKEDKAKELIAEAVNKRVKMPKSYEEYIIKKIQIARIIRIIDSDED